MTLELAFENRSLRHVCESEKKAQLDLGVQVAEMLKRRLADLRAATSVKDIVASQPHELDGALDGYLAIDLLESHSIVFCANHASNPLLHSGKVDWSKVSRVKIMSIGGNHE